jgi:hypothetical protein
MQKTYKYHNNKIYTTTRYIFLKLIIPLFPKENDSSFDTVEAVKQVTERGYKIAEVAERL